ncbi:MAG TPA: transglutaminase-like domain-containing protein [Candidatus Binatia bacterium]|nr:transglutaminase-like domain-containing protein [Candidatus Binatia bacterium]
MRRVLDVLVVVCWLVLVGRLAQRLSPGGHVPPPAAAVAEGEDVERDEWFGVERDGKRVGRAHRVTARTADGLRFTEDLLVSLVMLGTPQTVRTSLEAETDARFALRRVRFTLASPVATFSASGTSDGSRLAVVYGPEGRQEETSIPLREPIYLPVTLRRRVLAGDLAPGTTYAVPVLNPLTLRNEPVTVTVVGREALAGVEALVLTEEQHGMQARVWLAPDGAVLREEGSLGLTLVRETRAEALARDAVLVPLDLVSASRIPVAGRIDDPRAVARLTLRMDGASARRVPLDPPRQRVNGDVLRIERERVPARAPLGAADGALAEWVGPSPFIESDDGAIVATARTIAGDERDAAAIARALVAWVNDHLEQAPTVTVPSAREVLATRRGDCNEHAVLLAALARAAGIPARVVAGAMYLDGAFYYHAWNELWLGRWVSADAVFRQLPADATHVKLLEGGPEKHMELAGIVGDLHFTVEETIQ